MSQHTPGPWTVEDKACMPNGDELPIAAINGSWVACAWPYGDGEKPSEEQVANAHLISAAPELLSLLEEAVQMLVDCAAYRRGAEWEPRAVAAIAKAKGGAQ